MPKVLIVEDDASLRTLYTEEFTDEGYEVASVASGEEAIQTLGISHPDVVILDICLGGMNGLDVLRGILHDRPEIAVVLNSAYSGYKQDFASWSADQYVVKSSDLRELKDAVATTLRKRARRSERSTGARPLRVATGT